MPGDLAVIIPAFNEAERVGATVRAATSLPGAGLVVVVDDGSADDTAAVAERAGAHVVRHARNRGKAAALETGAEAVRLLESAAANGAAAGSGAAADGAAMHRAATDGAAAHYLLFLDADLGETAAQAGPLAEPVRRGTADMTIAVFSNRVRRGGFGIVTATAGAGIERATGWRPAQPVNGQRCLTRAAFEAALPLAGGWGVETGLTIDVLRRGLRITEVEVPLAHRVTGQDWRSQAHRARQLADIARALAVREPATQRRRQRARQQDRARARQSGPG
jgi:hypothetical protein